MSDTRSALYLGHEIDPESGDRTGSRLELESDGLTTHGLIVGMTGSGKTGLGVCLLEEVLSAGVPAIVLDPKGDIGNLLLNFPEFRGADFLPWVDEASARREGVSPDEYADREAEKWRLGLDQSGLGSEEMRRLRDRVDMRILTPGSTAGVPLNLVGDFSPPSADWEEHAETIRDEIEGLVSGLLVLAGIEADPLTSREHILLSNLVEHAWRERRALDLPGLIRQIQDPPLRRLGVFELDTFYPANDRMKLAMRLNGLVASPSFAEWMIGEPLDIGGLLRAPDGRPRASVVYLAHLSESERLFVVTLLLTKFVSWMRGQPGTSELRAMIYADEVVGFAPPSAEPPTKRPILTLFKQARAHGVGVVMATQNPVDVDYKVMSNAGTWMIGRLQTERDKLRIIEGLRSASGDVDVARWSDRIGALGKREFVLKRASSPEPGVFTTRWAMSYLRGPLTRTDLLRLRPEGAAAPPSPSGVAGTPGGRELAADETEVPPRVADGTAVRYLAPGATWPTGLGIGRGAQRLRPGIAARVRLLFDERVGDVRHEQEWEAVFFPLEETFDPDAAALVDHDPRDFSATPPEGATWVLGTAPIDRADFFSSVKRDIEEHLFREEVLQLRKNETLKLYSRPGESEEEFRARCLSEAEDRADQEAEKLRDRYETKLKSARRKLEDTERRLRELDVEVGQRKQQEMIAGAGEVLSMFLGGRRRVRSLSGMSSRRGQVRRSQERLRTASEKAEDHEETIAELEAQLEDELEEIWLRWKETAAEVDDFEVPLERSDVSLDELVLFWASRD